MASSSAHQLDKLINKSTHVLLLLPTRPNADVYCTALAIAHHCDVRSIRTTIAFADPYEETARLHFLSAPHHTTIRHSISGTRDLILSFKTAHNKILDVHTEQADDAFLIRITPEKGMIDSRDFSFMPAQFPYDLLITLGASDKEAMGILYEEVPDIFYEIPIVNIDNSSNNEQFGQVNIISPVASSVAEIVGDILLTLADKKLARPIAQCLLTGIISATNSFQNHNTTPHALTLSSTLIELGADQQTIIQHLYRNQTFSLLQLWGRAMKNLAPAKCHPKIIISTLTHSDIVRVSAHKHHIHAIVEKMSENYPVGKIFVLLYEKEDHTFIALVDTKNANLRLDDTLPTITALDTYSYEITLTAKTRDDAEDEMCRTFAEYLKILGTA